MSNEKSLVTESLRPRVASAHADATADKVRLYRRAHEKEIVTDFMNLLAIPDVATNVPDVERNAAYIEALLKQRGFATKILSAAPNTPPSVFAELKVGGAAATKRLSRIGR